MVKKPSISSSSAFGVIATLLYFGVSLVIAYHIFMLGTMYAKVISIVFLVVAYLNASRFLGIFLKKGAESPATLIPLLIGGLWHFINRKQLQLREQHEEQAQKRRLASKQRQLLVHAFLQKNPDILKQYERILKSKEALFAVNSVTDEQKSHAEQAVKSADKIVDEFYNVSLLNDASGHGKQEAKAYTQTALDKITQSLDDIISNHSAKFKLSIDHTYFLKEYEVKNRVDALRMKAEQTLARLKDYDGSGNVPLESIEEVMVIENILDYHLNDIYKTYQRAKKTQVAKDTYSPAKGADGDLLKLQQASSDIDVDKVMDDLLAEVDAYLSKVDSGVSSVKSSKAISQMLERQAYFKTRNLHD